MKYKLLFLSFLYFSITPAFAANCPQQILFCNSKPVYVYPKDSYGYDSSICNKKGLITFLQYENDQAYPTDHGTKWYLQFGDYYGVIKNCFWWLVLVKRD